MAPAPALCSPVTNCRNPAPGRTSTAKPHPGNVCRDVYCSALEHPCAYDLQSSAQPNLAFMDEDLTIDRSESFPKEVLALRGPLTAVNAPVFQNAMRREEPAETVILDLSDSNSPMSIQRGLARR